MNSLMGRGDDKQSSSTPVYILLGGTNRIVGDQHFFVVSRSELEMSTVNEHIAICSGSSGYDDT